MYIKRFVKHYYIMLIPALLWLGGGGGGGVRYCHGISRL